MATLASLMVMLGLDSSKYDKGLSDAERQTQAKAANLSKELGKIGSSVTGLGQKMSLFATAPIMAGFGMAIDKASDLSETMNKVQVLFGDVADDAIASSSRMDVQFGQSQQSWLDAISSFGIFGQAAGLAGEDLYTFSGDLAGLASDLASFYNTSPEEAITAIGAALRGESEPIRKYGILLDEASLRQKALEMGIISDIKNALTPQQRVLAANALIWKQSTVAQGDFERTSSGLANTQRIVKAQLENTAATIGQQLLPIALQLMQKISGLITLFTNLSPSTQKVILIVLAVVAAIGPLLMIIGTLISAIGAIIPIVTAVAGVLTFPLIAIIGAVIAIVALLALAWKNDWGGIQEKFAAVKDFLVNAFTTVSNWLKVNLPEAIQVVEGWINDHLIGPFNSVVTAISNVISWIGDLVNKFADLLGIDLPGWLTPGSPTPFELGLRGIADAIDLINTKSLPAFNANMSGMGGMGGGSQTAVGDIYANMSIYSQPGQSEEVIARKVVKRLEDAARFGSAGGLYAGT